MRVLLDTNILIHREARTVVREDIGALFQWLDRLHYQKLVHPASVEEVNTHADPEVRRSLGIKLGSYKPLKTIAPDTPAIVALRERDRTPNDMVDTSLLAEVAAGRVDVLISEDRGIHRKAVQLGVDDAVYTIDAFLEKVTAENPDLTDYKILSVRKEFFGQIDVRDDFFDSFRTDYPGFDQWFNRKADEMAYVCRGDGGRPIAFLYVKVEGMDEPYGDISPTLPPGKRLKIGTLKVASNGFKLGERFLKIAFDNAWLSRVDQLYVTIFRRTADQDRLYQLLEDWGFVYYGKKHAAGGVEEVLVRNLKPHLRLEDPRKSYPFVSGRGTKWIVPIYPDYHTELLPDSILNTESPKEFIEGRPNRNAISKVYVSRSINRSMQPGDPVVFYRTGSGTGPAHYTSVVTTLGVIQNVVVGIPDLETFKAVCRKRSVFTDQELELHWNYKKFNRPFVVNFLHVLSFPKRPNLSHLKDAGVLVEAPRGFEPLSDPSFDKLLELASADKSLVVS